MSAIIPTIPKHLVDILKDFAKNVLRDNPSNINLYAAQYFENRIIERDGSLDMGYEIFSESDKYFSKNCEKYKYLLPNNNSTKHIQKSISKSPNKDLHKNTVNNTAVVRPHIIQEETNAIVKKIEEPYIFSEIETDRNLTGVTDRNLNSSNTRNSKYNNLESTENTLKNLISNKKENLIEQQHGNTDIYSSQKTANKSNAEKGMKENFTNSCAAPSKEDIKSAEAFENSPENLISSVNDFQNEIIDIKGEICEVLVKHQDFLPKSNEENKNSLIPNQTEIVTSTVAQLETTVTNISGELQQDDTQIAPDNQSNVTKLNSPQEIKQKKFDEMKYFTINENVANVNCFKASKEQIEASTLKLDQSKTNTDGEGIDNLKNNSRERIYSVDFKNNQWKQEIENNNVLRNHSNISDINCKEKKESENSKIIEYKQDPSTHKQENNIGHLKLGQSKPNADGEDITENHTKEYTYTNLSVDSKNDEPTIAAESQNFITSLQKNQSDVSEIHCTKEIEKENSKVIENNQDLSITEEKYATSPLKLQQLKSNVDGENIPDNQTKQSTPTKLSIDLKNEESKIVPKFNNLNNNEHKNQSDVSEIYIRKEIEAENNKVIENIQALSKNAEEITTDHLKLDQLKSNADGEDITDNHTKQVTPTNIYIDLNKDESKIVAESNNLIQTMLNSKSDISDKTSKPVIEVENTKLIENSHDLSINAENITTGLLKIDPVKRNVEIVDEKTNVIENNEDLSINSEENTISPMQLDQLKSNVEIEVESTKVIDNNQDLPITEEKYATSPLKFQHLKSNADEEDITENHTKHLTPTKLSIDLKNDDSKIVSECNNVHKNQSNISEINIKPEIKAENTKVIENIQALSTNAEEITTDLLELDQLKSNADGENITENHTKQSTPAKLSIDLKNDESKIVPECNNFNNNEHKNQSDVSEINIKPEIEAEHTQLIENSQDLSINAEDISTGFLKIDPVKRNVEIVVEKTNVTENNEDLSINTEENTISPLQLDQLKSNVEIEVESTKVIDNNQDLPITEEKYAISPLKLQQLKSNADEEDIPDNYTKQSTPTKLFIDLKNEESKIVPECNNLNNNEHKNQSDVSELNMKPEIETENNKVIENIQALSLNAEEITTDIMKLDQLSSNTDGENITENHTKKSTPAKISTDLKNDESKIVPECNNFNNNEHKNQSDVSEMNIKPEIEAEHTTLIGNSQDLSINAENINTGLLKIDPVKRNVEIVVEKTNVTENNEDLSINTEENTISPLQLDQLKSNVEIEVESTKVIDNNQDLPITEEKYATSPLKFQHLKSNADEEDITENHTKHLTPTKLSIDLKNDDSKIVSECNNVHKNQSNISEINIKPEIKAENTKVIENIQALSTNAEEITTDLLELDQLKSNADGENITENHTKQSTPAKLSIDLKNDESKIVPECNNFNNNEHKNQSDVSEINIKPEIEAEHTQLIENSQDLSINAEDISTGFLKIDPVKRNVEIVVEKTNVTENNEDLSINTEENTISSLQLDQLKSNVEIEVESTKVIDNNQDLPITEEKYAISPLKLQQLKSNADEEDIPDNYTKQSTPTKLFIDLKNEESKIVPECNNLNNNEHKNQSDVSEINIKPEIEAEHTKLIENSQDLSINAEDISTGFLKIDPVKRNVEIVAEKTNVTENNEDLSINAEENTISLLKLDQLKSNVEIEVESTKVIDNNQDLVITDEKHTTSPLKLQQIKSNADEEDITENHTKHLTPTKLSTDLKNDDWKIVSECNNVHKNQSNISEINIKPEIKAKNTKDIENIQALSTHAEEITTDLSKLDQLKSNADGENITENHSKQSTPTKLSIDLKIYDSKIVPDCNNLIDNVHKNQSDVSEINIKPEIVAENTKVIENIQALSINSEEISSDPLKLYQLKSNVDGEHITDNHTKGYTYTNLSVDLKNNEPTIAAESQNLSLKQSQSDVAKINCNKEIETENTKVIENNEDLSINEEKDTTNLLKLDQLRSNAYGEDITDNHAKQFTHTNLLIDLNKEKVVAESNNLIQTMLKTQSDVSEIKCNQDIKAENSKLLENSQDLLINEGEDTKSPLKLEQLKPNEDIESITGNYTKQSTPINRSIALNNDESKIVVECKNLTKCVQNNQPEVSEIKCNQEIKAENTKLLKNNLDLSINDEKDTKSPLKFDQLKSTADGQDITDNRTEQLTPTQSDLPEIKYKQIIDGKNSKAIVHFQNLPINENASNINLTTANQEQIDTSALNCEQSGMITDENVLLDSENINTKNTNCFANLENNNDRNQSDVSLTICNSSIKENKSVTSETAQDSPINKLIKNPDLQVHTTECKDTSILNHEQSKSKDDVIDNHKTNTPISQDTPPKENIANESFITAQKDETITKPLELGESNQYSGVNNISGYYTKHSINEHIDYNKTKNAISKENLFKSKKTYQSNIPKPIPKLTRQKQNFDEIEKPQPSGIKIIENENAVLEKEPKVVANVLEVGDSKVNLDLGYISDFQQTSVQICIPTSGFIPVTVYQTNHNKKNYHKIVDESKTYASILKSPISNTDTEYIHSNHQETGYDIISNSALTDINHNFVEVEYRAMTSIIPFFENLCIGTEDKQNAILKIGYKSDQSIEFIENPEQKIYENSLQNSTTKINCINNTSFNINNINTLPISISPSIIINKSVFGDSLFIKPDIIENKTVALMEKDVAGVNPTPATELLVFNPKKYFGEEFIFKLKINDFNGTEDINLTVINNGNVIKFSKQENDDNSSETINPKKVDIIAVLEKNDKEITEKRGK